jgi:hypothetical protein
MAPTPRQREALALAERGLSERGVAEGLGVKPATAHVLLVRGRQRLASEHAARARAALAPELLPKRKAPRLTARCAFCDYEDEGPLEEARARWAEHECGRPAPSGNGAARGLRGANSQSRNRHRA